MAAPNGNQFWKNRSKHGRDKLFADADLLWKAACEYFEWCDSNPLIAIEYNGKDALKCEVPKMRAYTLTGFFIYIDACENWWSEFKKRDSAKDFMGVITRIEQIVFTQKFEGAAAGFLNANIIARDLGLVDKKEQNIVTEQPLFPDVSTDNSDK